MRFFSEEAKSESAYSETEGSVDIGEVKEAEEVTPASENNVTEPKQAVQDETYSETIQSTFSYDQLKAKSDNPVTGIDFKRREVSPSQNFFMFHSQRLCINFLKTFAPSVSQAYLSEEEFRSIFGVAKEAFYKLPKWKQDMQKKKFDLF